MGVSPVAHGLRLPDRRPTISTIERVSGGMLISTTAGRVTMRRATLADHIRQIDRELAALRTRLVAAYIGDGLP